jgi:hypothetical protein
VGVRNEREAVMRFVQERPDIAVVDCKLSQVDDVETASEILAIKPSLDLIIFTPHGKSPNERFERLNPDLILDCPITTKELVSSVVAVSNLHPMMGLVSR